MREVICTPEGPARLCLPLAHQHTSTSVTDTARRCLKPKQQNYFSVLPTNSSAAGTQDGEAPGGGGHPSAPHASGPALPRGLRGALGAPSRPWGAPKGALRGQGDAERPAPRPRRPPSPARPRPGLTRCGPAASRLSPMASPCGRQPGPPPGRSRARTPPRLSPARARRGSPSSRGVRLGPVGGEGGSRCTARGAVVFRKRGCTSTLK